jgi:hypothetical protein
MVGDTGVCDTIYKGGWVQRHGVEGIHEGLLLL